MLPTKQDQHNKPTTSVRGGFPVHFHYTAGIAGEKFLYGLKDKKLLATTCGSCDTTYLPAKMFCEDCFDELGEDSWTELEQTGELFSFSEVFVDHRGNDLEKPYFLGLIKVKGSDTTFFHKLVDISEPVIGMEVKAVWADDREGSLFDLKGFTA